MAHRLAARIGSDRLGYVTIGHEVTEDRVLHWEPLVGYAHQESCCVERVGDPLGCRREAHYSLCEGIFKPWLRRGGRVLRLGLGERRQCEDNGKQKCG